MRSPIGLNILVVDDDVNCLTTLEDLLASDGHRTCTATRGREALSLARQFRREDRRFQLSILDFDIPDMTGLETFAELSSVLPDIGAIFISGNSSDSLEGLITEAGGFALVRKPLGVMRVREAIRAYRGYMRRFTGY